MKRFAPMLLALAALWLPVPAQAAFGLHDVDVLFTGPRQDLDDAAAPLGPILSQAGAHPFEMTTAFRVNAQQTGEGGELPDEAVRDVLFTQMPGFAGAPTAAPSCSTSDFLSPNPADGIKPNCPDSAAVGIVGAQLATKTVSGFIYSSVYNLEPPPGKAARFGFWVDGVPVTVDAWVSEEPPYLVVAGPTNTSQLVEVVGSRFTLWGVPADPRHDPLRGLCVDHDGTSLGACPADIEEKPFLTMPRNCAGPLATDYFTRSWLGSEEEGSVLTHDEAGNPQGMTGCGALAFDPQISAQPTSKAATSPTGLDFSLDVHDEGLLNPDGIAGADVSKTIVALPEGMTINPSQAEGLEVCSEAQLEGETSQSAPGEGCPNASKIGTLEVETPLLEDKLLKGSLYVAEPHANLAEDSLIAVYVVIQNRALGISIKLPLKVEPDLRTGQLLTTADDLPELPFSHFRLHFREGGRSPLISPPACGTHTVEAELFPSSGNPPVTATSSFQVISGPNGGPCPQGGTPPFEPSFTAGTLNNSAGAYSPFAMRLQRRDGDQDLVRFDATLPPGAVAKLAGVGKCSDAEIASIKTKTGLQELANPSCPADSKIGTVKAGAGVGSQLTYVPGSVYLAGPFAGAPLSVVGVVPAVAGPFDVGVVSTRQALTLDPVTAEVKVDGSRSEPIPHILAGIPLAVRDIQVNVDRPNFTLNPTNCEPMAVEAAIWGGGADVFGLQDDSPVARSQRFQAADCAALGFKPRLTIDLKGGTKRGDHPGLKAILTPRPGDANLKRTVVKLPKSAFLDQAHIGTICTRVQFAADACPKGSVYGRVRAFTPLLEEPLEGNAYLRSSENLLPDLVFDLKGIVDVEASARIDSVRGGIRATFATIPDAPVSKVIVKMAGGKKGLIVNSRNLCAAPSRAEVKLGAHNGRRRASRPLVRPRGCGGKARKGKRRGSG